MQSLIKAYNTVIVALAVFGGAIIAGIFLLIIVDVSIRTLGFSPPALTISTVEYSLLFFTMCCAPYLVRQKGHVFIEAFITILPMTARRVIEKIVYFACVVCTFAFSVISVGLLMEALESGAMDVRGVDMPMWLLYAPLPLGFFLVSMEFLRYLIGIDTMYNYDLGEVRDSV